MRKVFIALSLMFILATPAGAEAPKVASSQTSVTGVRLGAHPNAVTRVVMDVTDTTKFRVRLLAAPYRVIIDTHDVTWPTRSMTGKPVGAVARVRYEDDDHGRMVIELSRPVAVKAAFMLGPSEGLGWRFVLDLKDTTPQAFRADAPPLPAKPVVTPVATAPTEPPAPAADLQPPVLTQVIPVLSSPAAAALPTQPAAPAVLAMNEEAARNVVRSATADMLGSFAGKTLKPAESRAAVQQLVDKYCDIGIESQLILGRYWTRATPAQREEFQGLLERFLVTMVGGMIDGVPAGQRFTIQGTETHGDRVVVHSIAQVEHEADTVVKWVVMNGASGRPVIVDVSADGVALITTMQGDFTSVVRSAGAGGMDVLFESLRTKIAGLSAFKSGKD
jgi:ABC-type transporter MlaC component